jgi:hypothetical protein
LILRAYEALMHEAETSATFRWVLLQRARDAARKRERLFAAGVPEPLDSAQFESLRRRILRFRDRVTKLAGETDTSSNAKARSVVETA